MEDREAAMPAALAGGTAAAVNGTQATKKLVILCIHGFRQNAKQFKGRLAGLQRKLAGIATFVFIDAPYVLPLWYKPAAADTTAPDPQQQPSEDGQRHHPQNQQCQPQPTAGRQLVGTITVPQQLPGPNGRLPAPKRAWLLSQDLLEAQPRLQSMYQQQQQQQQQQQRPEPANLHENTQDKVTEPSAAAAAMLPGWQVAPAGATTASQHASQCYGWQASWAVIQDALGGNSSSLQLQQVDGMLGFSQGAAVVAAVVAELQRKQRQQVAGSGSSSGQAVHQQRPLHGPRFAILASGFVSPVPEHHQLLQEQQPLQLPSLHVYAAAGQGCACSGDRQIQQQLSDELYQLWEPAAKQRILHDGGHLIPCRKDIVNDIKAFLEQFVMDGEQQQHQRLRHQQD